MIHNIFQAWIVIWKAILNITAFNLPFASLILYLPWKSHLLPFWCSQDAPLTFCQSFTPLELQESGYIHYLTKWLKIHNNIQKKQFWWSIFSKHTLCNINCSPLLHTHSQLEEDFCDWEAWLPFWSLWHNEISGLEASCSLHLVSTSSSESRERSCKGHTVFWARVVCCSIAFYHTGLMLPVKSFCFTFGSGKCKLLKAGECILTNQDMLTPAWGLLINYLPLHTQEKIHVCTGTVHTDFGPLQLLMTRDQIRDFSEQE